jgi:uncharacterized protein DUF4340
MSNTKSLIPWLVAVLALGGAWMVYQGQSGSNPEQVSDPSQAWFLADFRDQVNQVQRLQLRKGDQTLSVHREGAAWLADDYSNYPLRFEKVREFLLQLASLKNAQRKTSDPGRHAELDLLGPGEAAGAHLQVWSDGAEPTLDLIVGRNKWRPKPGVYLRYSNQDQCWLVEGQFNPQADAKLWMDRQVITLNAAEIASIKISGDAEYQISRPDASTPLTLNVEALEGRSFKEGNPYTALLNSLSWANFDSVEAATAERYQSDPDRVIRWTSFAGAAISMQIWKVEDGACWIRITKTPAADAAAEAADSDPDLSAWAFQFPASKATIWFQGLDDWLAPVEAESENSGDQAPAETEEGSD